MDIVNSIYRQYIEVLIPLTAIFIFLVYYNTWSSTNMLTDKLYQSGFNTPISLTVATSYNDCYNLCRISNANIEFALPTFRPFMLHRTMDLRPGPVLRDRVDPHLQCNTIVCVPSDILGGVALCDHLRWFVLDYLVSCDRILTLDGVTDGAQQSCCQTRRFEGDPCSPQLTHRSIRRPIMKGLYGMYMMILYVYIICCRINDVSLLYQDYPTCTVQL